MTDPNRCPTCGCEIPADAGLCPECLLRQGFAENDSLAVEVSEDAGGSGLPVTTPPAPFEPPPAEELASLFPGLEIVKLLGHGGMGAVYQARQTKLDRLVALKIIRPESASDPAFAERFLREARTLARLSHPSIVGVHDFGEVETQPASEEASSTALFYFVMEYVDGANLRQLIEAGELEPEAAIAIVPQLCEALQFAHDQGVIHRDIKPENILVDSRGQVKIADFGLARLTESSPRDFTLTATHQVMGTPRYMAPEQMEGSRDVDHRADIYSLGVVFYEMLTGQVPAGHFDPPSKKVQIDVRLDEVVLRSLAREPERRYQQVSEVKTDVESISRKVGKADQSIPATAPPESEETILLASQQNQVRNRLSDAAAQVRSIATAMLVCGIVEWVLVPLLAAGFAGWLWNFGPDDWKREVFSRRDPGAPILIPAFWLVGFASVLIFASLQLRQLRFYWLGILAAVISIVLIPVNLAGLPIGLWALSVLFRGDVRELFSAVSSGTASPADFLKQPSAATVGGFSRKAILAACWAPFVFGVPLAFAPGRAGAEVVWPMTWQWPLIFTVGPLGVAAPFATTILGWLALSDLRQPDSNGRGLGLACTCALLFPLLLLDAAIFTIVGALLEFLFPSPHLISSQNLWLAFLISAPVFIVADILIARSFWNRVNPDDQSGSSFEQIAPLTQFRFSTDLDRDLSEVVPFHFEGLGYRPVASTDTEWVFERGTRFSGLWSTDMKTYHTKLTVRAATIAGTTQIDCSWAVRTWGAFFTNSEITRLEDEGRGLARLLNGEGESLSSPDSSSEDIDSVRVGSFSVGRTAVGLLIFFGVICGASYILWLIMTSLDENENRDGANDNGGNAVATIDDPDSGEAVESQADASRKRNAGLRIAATEGDLKAARQLLHDGADPNTFSKVDGKPIDGRTPVMIAAAHGNAPMVALLLALGAEPSMQDNDGQTALMLAAVNSHDDVIRVIFEICDQKFGNQVVFRDHLRDKTRAADSVFQREDIPAVPTQLRPIDIDGLFIRSGEELQDSKGETALMKAAAAGDAESVKLLSGAGRRRDYEDLKALQICEMQDKAGRTAFMHALLAGRKELIVAACHTDSDFPKAGTNQLPSFCHTSVLGIRDVDGNSVLDLASSGDPEISEVIRNGLAEVLAWASGKIAGGVYLTNLQIPLRQRAEAYWALGHTELAQADYDFKAQLDQLDNPTLAGRIFALFESAEQGNATLIKKQLAEKVDPNSRNPAGETPLMKAVESGDLQTVVVLILRGADERAQDKLGRTPLMHAAAAGQAEVVKLLLEMEQLHTNADLQFRLTRLDSELPLNTDFTKMRFNPAGLKDNLWRTAIFHAVQAESVESTLPLIRKFSSHSRDKADFTPLMYAVQAKSFEFLKQVAVKDSWSVYTGSFLQPSSFFYWNGVTGEPYVGDDTLIQYLKKNGATEAEKILRSKIHAIITKCTMMIEESKDKSEALRMRERCYRELGMAEEAAADAKAAEKLRQETADE